MTHDCLRGVGGGWQRTVCERKDADAEWKRIQPDLEHDPVLPVYTRLSVEEIAAGIPPRTILIKICIFLCRSFFVQILKQIQVPFNI